MARLRLVSNDNKSVNVLSIKENRHIRKANKYKRLSIILGVMAIIDLVLLLKH